jgi:predicted ATPase
LEVNIVNVGPIRSANVRLAPLTILVGPNNSGKSMVLEVLYSAFAQVGVYIPFEMTRPIRLHLPEDENDQFAQAMSMIAAEPKKPGLVELPDVAKAFLTARLDDSLRLYAEIVVDQLARCAGAPIGDLRRAHKGTSTSSITIVSEAPKWKLTIRLNAKGISRHIEAPSLEQVWASVSRDQWRRFRARLRTRPRTALGLSDLSTELVRACFSDFPRHTRYMPAARSGLMQSHKALSGSLVRRAAYAGIRDMQIPAVNGVIADFLGEMVELGPRSNGHFAAHATRVEQEILNGAIELAEDSSSGSTEPVYKSTDGAFTLNRTSSMISELAPFVLYLRHLMQRGDLLMLEEPEAHLHPQAQVALARTLARLVNEDLAIAMTTHSEFFLQQVNNAVVASRVNGEDSDRIGLDAEARLSADNVASYLFRPESDGTHVLPLEVSSREGIPESSFSDVAEYLYDQAVALDKRVTGDSEE